VREANEDNGRHISPNDADLRASRGTLTIIADGMGGHASGEVASQMAVELISEAYYSELALPPADALRSAIESANHTIFDASTTDERYFGMGTTVIALVLRDGMAFSAHIGDSRLYRMRGGRLEMLTMDHSQVMEMVKHGIISMADARHHDDKNVILRAVGTQPSVEVEVSPPFATEIGDVYLLCSDGLTDMIEDGEIETVLASEPDIYSACEQMIAAAKAAGGHDNVTAAVVRIDIADDARPVGQVRVTRELEAFV
jgi:protein phosphatase